MPYVARSKVRRFELQLEWSCALVSMSFRGNSTVARPLVFNNLRPEVKKESSGRGDSPQSPASRNVSIPADDSAKPKIDPPSPGLGRAGIVCPVCGATVVQEKCKIICRSETCRGRVIMNCSEF